MTSINNLTQFVPGTKALASEINDNFETLRQGHNSQETRLGTLETNFTTLETNGGEDLINVEKAGAKCDDLTDDTAIIQSILDSGKNPFIPANKSVKITNTLVFKALGQGIFGANSYTSVLRWHGAANGLMINASYNNVRIENIKLDGLSTSGVNGINLAKNSSTYNQILRNVRVSSCGGVGIQGFDADSPQYFANDGYFEKCQVSSCITGMSFRVPTQHLTDCRFDGCSTALAAYANSKINISGGIFSANEYDIKYDNAEITCSGSKFENGTQKIFSTFTGSSANLSLLSMIGCHIHTLTTQAYAIDLSEVTTSGSFVFLGNTFASDSATKNINLSSKVSNFISHNSNIGSIKGAFNLTKSGYVPYSVSSGSIDANGYASFISKVDNSTVTIQATSTNIVLIYPDSSQEIIPADQNVASIADSSTTVFIKEKNNDIVQKATGVTESYQVPSGGSDGDYWLQISVKPYKPFKKISGVWTETQFVKLGEATKTSGTLGTPISYAFNGQCISLEYTGATSTTTVINHNIGTTKIKTKAMARCATVDGSYAVNDIGEVFTGSDPAIMDQYGTVVHFIHGRAPITKITKNTLSVSISSFFLTDIEPSRGVTAQTAGSWKIYTISERAF